ncbi:MAG: glycosyltransferase [Limnobacter sp.]|uniref:glycosyltransferase n=1 Tax=Limnobacter sp. TaxID=2003368 RepID=UPI0032EF540F
MNKKTSVQYIPISIIIPCFNDHKAFSKTLESIQAELKSADEIIVVDSSKIKSDTKKILKRYNNLTIHYNWHRPNGVYFAQNTGISRCTKQWIQIINSGDTLTYGARKIINDAITSNPDVEIHVFSQTSGVDGQYWCTYTPSDKGIWPHQSTIISKRTYDNHGSYDTRYKIVSDQVFLSKIRKTTRFKLYEHPLTYYDLKGISSKINIQLSKELYILWRSLGCSHFMSFIKSTILPATRVIMSMIVGDEKIIKIKALIKRNHRLAKK